MALSVAGPKEACTISTHMAMHSISTTSVRIHATLGAAAGPCAYAYIRSLFSPQGKSTKALRPSAAMRIEEVVHPCSLSFPNQRKVVLLRDVHGQSWTRIASQVVNLRGGRPSRVLVARVYKKSSRSTGRVRLRYGNCGRRPWKVTAEVRSFLISRLRMLRRRFLCTSTMLQRELARDKGVYLEASTIRRALTSAGYKWLPRAQKRKYSTEDRKRRLTFARRYAAMRPPQLRASIAMAIDGIVLSMPPKNDAERANWCAHGDTHMWRKASEAASPELAGDEQYAKQVPPDRAVPMWGGITHKGFALLCFHPQKKLSSPEWARVVGKGTVADAIRAMQPQTAEGPWPLLADNESFLRAEVSRDAYSEEGLCLVPNMPPRSPDLNPIERYWAWLRRKLRKMDLHDLHHKRPRLGKTAYKARVRAVCKTMKSQQVAAACFKGLQKVCREVVQKKGAAARA